MKNDILELLKENNITKYLIDFTDEETLEFFFIKKNLDLKRSKNISKAVVTIYNDLDEKLMAQATFIVEPCNTKEEIDKKIKDAYNDSMYVKNKKYSLAKSNRNIYEIQSSFNNMKLSDIAKRYIDTIYKCDNDKDAFINSLELFVIESKRNIISSNNLDVSYSKKRVYGEFVVQCKHPLDTELYQDFHYNDFDDDNLENKINDAFVYVKDKSRAKKGFKTGNYDIILSDYNLYVLMSFYLKRADAKLIYSKYSDYDIGKIVQSNIENAEKINIDLKPLVPFSSEGVIMNGLSLVENGILKNIQSDCRYASYLNIQPTGIYSSIKMNNGTISFDDMKKRKSLYIVSFSDFQMDEFTGYFAGEIRLAYLNDGNNTTIVTSGSINGSIFEAQKNFEFSIEKQNDINFEGPKAIFIKNVSVSCD